MKDRIFIFFFVYAGFCVSRKGLNFIDFRLLHVYVQSKNNFDFEIWEVIFVYTIFFRKFGKYDRIQ